MSNSFFRFSSVPLPKARPALKANTVAPSGSMIFQQQRRHRHGRPGKSRNYTKASFTRLPRYAPKGPSFCAAFRKKQPWPCQPRLQEQTGNRARYGRMAFSASPKRARHPACRCPFGLLGVQSMRGKTLAELWQTPVELSSGPTPPPLHMSSSEGGTSLPYRTSKPSVSVRLVLRNHS